MYLLVAGNDTVPISMQRHCADFNAAWWRYACYRVQLSSDVVVFAVKTREIYL